jgi:hypothetical protein
VRVGVKVGVTAPDTVTTAHAIVTAPVINCRAAQLVTGPEEALALIWVTKVTVT